MSLSKTRDLRQVFYLSEAPSLQGKGGGGAELTREKVRGEIVHKVGSKIPTWLTESPVYKLY